MTRRDIATAICGLARISDWRELGCWGDLALNEAEGREGLFYVLVRRDLGRKTLPYWGLFCYG